MATLYDRCSMLSLTVGSGTFSLTSAAIGFRAFWPTIPDASVVPYTAFESSTGNWEMGTGTTGTSGTKLTRNFTESSTGSGVFFSGGQVVYIDARAADILNPANNLSDVANARLSLINIGSVPSTSPVFPSGVVFPASPTVTGTGGIWQHNAQDTLTYQVSGDVAIQSGTIYSIFTPISVAGSGTQSLLGTSGIGTKIIPAGFFQPGRVLKIVLAGSFNVSNGSAVTVNITVGGKTIASSNGLSASTSLSGLGVFVEYSITCATTGTSGVINCAGTASHGGNFLSTQLGTSGIFNTAGSGVVDVTWQTNNSASATITTAQIEMLC